MIEIASYSSSNEKIMSYFLFTICCEAADLEKNGYESNESHSLGTTVYFLFVTFLLLSLDMFYFAFSFHFYVQPLSYLFQGFYFHIGNPMINHYYFHFRLVSSL